MIKFVEMECPNCAGKLTKTGEKTAKCSHCGMEYLIDSGQPEHVTNIYQSQGNFNEKNTNMIKAFVALGALIGIYLVFIRIKALISSGVTRKEHNPTMVTSEYEEEQQ